MKHDAPMTKNDPNWSLAAGAAAAVGASLCCVAPLLLILAGLGGAWLSVLRDLEPYRPLFIAVGVVALAFAARQVFKPLDACEPGEVCAIPDVRRRRQILFWAVTALVAAGIASPYLIAYLL